MIELNHDLQPSGPASAHRMRWRKRNALIPMLGAIFALSSGLPAAADSIDISYAATDVSGSTWEYVYTLSGSVSPGDLLAIYFPLATSSSLTDSSTTSSDITTSVLQPDSSIPADGEYDIEANSSASTFADTFDVSLTYSGTGTPASQTFTLYDSSFATITSGATTQAVTATPEPGSLALLASGLVLLLAGLLAGCGKTHRTSYVLDVRCVI